MQFMFLKKNKKNITSSLDTPILSYVNHTSIKEIP